MEVCGEAEDAQQALELIRNTSPDLAIVDITLKEPSGLDLIKKIRELPTAILAAAHRVAMKMGRRLSGRCRIGYVSI